jgi:hypothetical protein
MSIISQDLNATLGFKNEYIIYENEIRCKIGENDFNFSYNPTLQEGEGKLKPFTTSSNFTPYITTVGLYNEVGDLLMVAKLAQSFPLSSVTDTTIIVRYDL